MSGKAVAKGVGNIALAVAPTAAQFAPLPYLKPAVDAFLVIVELVRNVHSNRSSMGALCKECELLLKALETNDKKYSPSKLDDIVNDFVRKLNEIQESVRRWANRSWLSQFALQSEISGSISGFCDDIKSLDTRFGKISNLEVHNTLGRNEENRKKDNEENVEILSDIRNQVKFMCEVMVAREAGGAQQQMSMLAIANMQELLATKEPDEKDTGLRRNLYAVQEASGKLLPRTQLTREVVYEVIKRHDAFDVYRGKYLDTVDCAIKVVRDGQLTEKILRRFKRECDTWHDLYERDQGNYILPLLGCIDQERQLFTVSPWMKNGTAISYVKSNPSADHKKMIRHIAEGINFLHSSKPPIAHGDIKGDHIFINDYGNPVLADFALSKKVEEEGVFLTNSGDIFDSHRWFAPEIFDQGKFSTASDVYSYAMTVLELMTGEKPFAEILNAVLVSGAIMMGTQPVRPSMTATKRGLDDGMWKLLQSCWSKQHERPTIVKVLEQLPPE